MEDACYIFNETLYETINETNNHTYNGTEDTSDENQSVVILTTIYIIIMSIFCLIALTINIVVIISAFWIRRPIQPALKLSLSLAVADATTSILYMSTLLGTTAIILELFRLTGILVTVVHLLALSLNYYLGILRPLHYNSIVTRKKLISAILIIWTFPALVLLIIFSCEGGPGFWTMNTLTTSVSEITFMDRFRFRFTFSISLAIPIVLMTICFTHILIIIKRHTREWIDKERKGSTKFRGRTVKYETKAQKEKKKLEGNIKAIYTTLLIIGSCVMGWTPAIIMFVTMCKCDCSLSEPQLSNISRLYPIESITLRFTENMLIILKMLANPVIYCIRMKDIQEGMKRMYKTITGPFCPQQRNSALYRSFYRGSPLACSEGTLHVRLASIKTNGSSHVCRSEFGNSLL